MDLPLWHSVQARLPALSFLSRPSDDITDDNTNITGSAALLFDVAICNLDRCSFDQVDQVGAAHATSEGIMQRR